MKYLISILLIGMLFIEGCASQGKTLPATCTQQLKNLSVLEQELAAVKLALEICAAQPPAQ